MQGGQTGLLLRPCMLAFCRTQGATLAHGAVLRSECTYVWGNTQIWRAPIVATPLRLGSKRLFVKQARACAGEIWRSTSLPRLPLKLTNVVMWLPGSQSRLACGDASLGAGRWAPDLSPCHAGAGRCACLSQMNAMTQPAGAHRNTAQV